MNDDGNCQFRAISFGLYKTEDYYPLMRHIAVWQLLRNKEQYQFWFDDGEQGLREFCNEMAKNGTWGTELTLKALVDALGITLHILQSTDENFYLCYEPEDSASTSNSASQSLNPLKESNSSSN